jgi:hypothetical protein
MGFADKRRSELAARVRSAGASSSAIIRAFVVTASAFIVGQVCFRIVLGAEMNPVSVLRTVDSKAPDRKSHGQGSVEGKCQPISLLSFLEAENIRLRQAVVELSLHTLALRKALKTKEST